ncbi:Z1 domain-containing protein [Thalassomonas viridans]|uniref:Z1 domain-containing protein n=1 Tax=Thalassomonas viridans TaxID=137584 RepID=A0AAE9Z0C5_9GAMM|nr:Z1 domain-containing protein [Thalassomonas viridans]WDE03709.1 Z1 domain-containing protein [Thalassomonas viridans]
MMNTYFMSGFIKNRLKQHKEKYKTVSREFFETEDLKITIRADTQMFQLTQDKFESLYSAAIKECRHEELQSMTPSTSISTSDTKKRNWLTEERKAEIGWSCEDKVTFRSRYMEYLALIGRSTPYIDETKRSSYEIVKKLGDPKNTEHFYVRGLVVGSVQSGKTANFNAVINSSIDAGYGLIIVLSGIMEDLRKQTQRRIEKEVQGKFENGELIGVSQIAHFGQQGPHRDIHPIVVPTSTETDFKKTIKEADFSLEFKNVLVCKKNTSVLKNLILWLSQYLNKNKDKISIPLLIIDDEADNASLNNLGPKGVDYASTINGHIRALLGLFKKKTYLGYTATPFANVLQDRNQASETKWKIVEKATKAETKQNLADTVYEFEQVDSLFPNDFIELLFPPSNYIGAKHFFETRLNDVKKIDPLITKPIKDHYDAFPSRVMGENGPRAALKYDPYPQFIPESLKEAVMCFVISTAIRISRKSEMRDSKFYQPHNTMLIHTSRFTTWQIKTKKLVQAFVDELERDLNNELPTDKMNVYGKFEQVWNKHYAYIIENIKNYLADDYDDRFLTPKTFGKIKPLLIKAIEDIEVKAINSEPPKDQLTYPEGSEKKYIAIGGNRLSRGFTLEGLTINYFVRNTNLADTLLQMGRWFGYRPGYLDCCKLFTTEESLEKFDQTTATIEDLEQRFIDMNRDPQNTPEKYALKVLSHPGVLKLTRASILKNTEEVKFSYSDHLVQTTKFNIEIDRIKNAWNAFKVYIAKIKNEIKEIKSNKGKTEYLSYEPEKVEAIFELFNLANSFDGPSQKLNEVEEFIRACNEEGKLTDWTVVIKMDGSGEEIDISDLLDFPCKFRKTKRSAPSDRWRDLLKNEHIFSPGGGSSNLVTGGQDFKIRLSDSEIKIAEDDFKEVKLNELKERYPGLEEDELIRKVKKITIPEKVYRRKMTDKEGVVVIYLMDLAAVFKDGNGDFVDELDVLRESVDTSIPLIGYAIGIPPISGDVGAKYIQNKEVMNIEEYDDFDDMKEVLDQ